MPTKKMKIEEKSPEYAAAKEEARSMLTDELHKNLFPGEKTLDDHNDGGDGSNGGEDEKKVVSLSETMIKIRSALTTKRGRRGQS